MTLASHDDAYEPTVVPRAAVRFPLELPAPRGFDPGRLDTWPRVHGRLEFVDGALWFMPSCGVLQQTTVADATTELNLWRREHEEFLVGTNEAGMKLADEVRAADAAVWRRSDVGELDPKLARVPPVLAVEVSGRDEALDDLRAKARWYLERGVEAVWILDPTTRIAYVVTADDGEAAAYLRGQRMPPIPSLPGLSPSVSDLFRQIGSD